MSEPLRYAKPIELRRLGRRHAIVEASAGTGKTYVLEHLVVDLLLRSGVSLDQILVVTFTEKATIELTRRIRRKLTELAHLSAADPGALPADAAGDDDAWLLDDHARDRLRHAVQGFDRANILTIHAFCQRILTENAFGQGRLFDEKTIDEREAFHATFVETLRRDVAPDGAEAVLLEAWRRTGHSIERLERMLCDAAGKLACIFPARAGSLRPEARLDPALIQRAVATWPALDSDDDGLKFALNKKSGLHGNTVRYLVPRLRLMGGALAELADGLPALLAALEHANRAAGSVKKKARLSAQILKDLATAKNADDPLAAGLRRSMLAVDAAMPPLGAALAHHLLPALRTRQEQQKRGAGLYDFQDMLTLVARSMENDDPSARALIAALRARYRFALVDEFQDTDETQWQIFRRLFFAPGSSGVLTLVGDPKQAIYSFRGADVHTYLRARDEVAGIQAPLYLTASYRSTAALIAAQNALLDQRDPAPFFRADGPIHYDHPVTCGRPTLALVDARGRQPAPVVVLDVTRDQAAPEPKLRFWEIKPALLDWIATEVDRLLAPEGKLSVVETQTPDRSQALGARDIFVLTRTVRESREVGEALRARGVPFAYFKQEKLFDTVEAKAVLDLLRALGDPESRSARFRAFITEFFGLTLLDLAMCDNLPADHPLMQRLDDWRALGDAGQVDQLFARILDESGVVSRELFAQGVKGRASERALANYLHLFELLQREAAREPCTLRELAQRLGSYIAGTRRPPDSDADVQRLETDAEAVQIMTIHQSKGLEAGVVFVYGATWPFYGNDVRMFHDDAGQRLIHVGRQSELEEDLYRREQDDEELRVLYVALTRARARVYLPRYPSKVCDLRGTYKFLNDRLQSVLGGITPDEIRCLFQIETVLCPRRLEPRDAGRGLVQEVGRWQPPAALLAPPQPDPAFREAATTRAGFVVTSYSAIRASHPHAPPDAAPEPDTDADTVADTDSDLASPLAAPPASDELPRGRLSGTFLHDLIEHLPLDTLARAPVFEDWCRLPEVGELFERMRRRHDRDPAHLAHAQRLVHTALAVPVRLGEATVPALGAAERPTREMEFLFPIPSLRHPGMSRAGGADSDGGGDRADNVGEDLAPWRIERGVVKGFIDYLFEHDGRVYVCDWKSDSLPGWEPAGLAARCERDYAVQAQIYTVAAARLLGLHDAAAFERRFGGVLYCFLRGMHAGDPEAGIYFRRPAWADVLAWQRAMLEPRYWGLA